MKKILSAFICVLILPLVAKCSDFDTHSFYRYNDYSPSSEKAENVLIILDSSYSMNEQIDGRRKIDIAKNVIYKVLRDLSPNVKVGLRVYGDKTGIMGFGGCKSTSLKVPINFKTRENIKESLIKIQPTGMTPITYSLNQAIDNDFNGLNGPKRIILISDGMETCGGNPCDYAVKLFKGKTGIKIDVIGFNLSEIAAVSQLKCVALTTKGRFYNAKDENDLADSLIDSLNILKEVQGKVIVK